MEHGGDFLGGGRWLLGHLGGNGDQDREEFSDDTREDIVGLTESSESSVRAHNHSTIILNVLESLYCLQGSNTSSMHLLHAAALQQLFDLSQETRPPVIGEVVCNDALQRGTELSRDRS